MAARIPTRQTERRGATGGGFAPNVRSRARRQGCGGASTDPDSQRTTPMSKRGNGEGSIYFQDSRQRWASAVTLDNGKRKVLYGKTRQEVAKKLTAALQWKDQGVPFASERLTVGAWLDHWMEDYIRPRRDASTGEQVGGREPTTFAS
jgi:hypothetical protein